MRNRPGGPDGKDGESESEQFGRCPLPRAGDRSSCWETGAGAQKGQENDHRVGKQKLCPAEQRDRPGGDVIPG